MRREAAVYKVISGREVCTCEWQYSCYNVMSSDCKKREGFGISNGAVVLF